jgi:hypothetical protein
MHIHSPNKPRKFKQTGSARKLMATVFWSDGGVHAARATVTSQVIAKHKILHRAGN